MLYNLYNSRPIFALPWVLHICVCLKVVDIHSREQIVARFSLSILYVTIAYQQNNCCLYPTVVDCVGFLDLHKWKAFLNISDLVEKIVLSKKDTKNNKEKILAICLSPSYFMFSKASFLRDFKASIVWLYVHLFDISLNRFVQCKWLVGFSMPLTFDIVKTLLLWESPVSLFFNLPALLCLLHMG